MQPPAGQFSTAAHWEQVGWTTDDAQFLTHRNFAILGTPSSTLFVPNPTGSPRTFGAGTSVACLDGTIVTWTEIQRQIPADFNPDFGTPINLSPIWAPVRTELNYVLGTPPTSSGTITPASPLDIDRTLDAGGIRLTNQSFTFPSSSDVFTVSTGALWRQVGWTLQGSPKLLPPLATLATHGNANDFGFGATYPSTHPEFATSWGATRDIHPVWQRVITHGNVNLAFVGGPEGFMDGALQALDLHVTMPFTVNTADNKIYHAGTTSEVLLASFEEMTTLGLEYGLTFQGWYIRTSWAMASQRIDNTATPTAKVAIPWQNGVYTPNWEPYILIEARWT